MNLNYLEFPAKAGQQASGLIVTLHGWGANAEDVATLFPFFNLPNFYFIFPNAPYPYPYSPVGKAWYDLQAENMYEGLAESRQTLLIWLQSLPDVTGIPLSRTILSGFSQGGAMTLDVGLKLPFAGLVSMSGYLHPDAGKVETQLIASPPPVLIMHGTRDDVVPLKAAHQARSVLEAQRIAVEYHEFNSGHEIIPEMLENFKNFIAKVIS